MTRTVCLHAWRYEGQDQTYADPSTGEVADGWCVYLRRDRPDCDPPFDVDVDEDFETQLAAEAFAAELAGQHACAIQRY